MMANKSIRLVYIEDRHVFKVGDQELECEGRRTTADLPSVHASTPFPTCCVRCVAQWEIEHD
jgi:hypothetical protein